MTALEFTKQQEQIVQAFAESERRLLVVAGHKVGTTTTIRHIVQDVADVIVWAHSARALDVHGPWPSHVTLIDGPDADKALGRLNERRLPAAPDTLFVAIDAQLMNARLRDYLAEQDWGFLGELHINQEILDLAADLGNVVWEHLFGSVSVLTLSSEDAGDCVGLATEAWRQHVKRCSPQHYNSRVLGKLPNE